MLSIPETDLRAITTKIFRSAGSDAYEAEVITDHLVRANLAGHDSHGVGMIPHYIAALGKDNLAPNQHPELCKDDGSIMMFDGRKGYGQVQAKEAVEQAIARCHETGLVLMTLRNSHHVGRIGTYGEQGSEAGLVSLHFVNVVGHDPVVAPYGGRESRFVTNPICLAMPATANNPSILLDMATSKIALGKARVALHKGEDVPEGSIITAEGLASNDPAHLFKEPFGALLPFGEHKGYSLALFCELLAGGLSGGGTIQPNNPRNDAIHNNMLSILVDPKRLADIAWLERETDALIAYVRSTAPDAQSDSVKIAGDPERENQEERQRQGIPIAEAAWQAIQESAATVGMDASDFTVAS